MSLATPNVLHDLRRLADAVDHHAVNFHQRLGQVGDLTFVVDG